MKDSGSINEVKRKYLPVQASYDLVQEHMTGRQQEV